MKQMYFNSYQDSAQRFAKYPQDTALTYVTLGLASEAGEVAGKLKKIIRDSGGLVDLQAKVALGDELGDVLWYVSECARHLGLRLEDVARGNLAKLASRAERGVLGGSGDNR